MREGAIQRVGECHCGALKVIAAGEPERVYLCHCEESMQLARTTERDQTSSPRPVVCRELKAVR
jgi:hypothetical protein